MNVPNSSTFQAAFGKARSSNVQKTNDKDREAHFKTSNPQIFPSLHPLSGFYRERTKRAPMPAFQAPRSLNVDPVKKIRMNDQSEIKIHAINQDSFRERSIGTSSRDEFKVPRLPSRLAKKSQRMAQEPIQTVDVEQLHASMMSFKEPAPISQDFLHELNSFQKKTTTTTTTTQTQKTKKEKKTQHVPQTESVWKVNNINTKRDIEEAPKTTNLQTIYERLQQDYLALQLQQQFQNLVGILQQNQQKELNNLRNIYHQNSLWSNTMNIPIAKNLDNMEDSSVKREIHC